MAAIQRGAASLTWSVIASGRRSLRALGPLSNLLRHTIQIHLSILHERQLPSIIDYLILPAILPESRANAISRLCQNL